MSEHQPPSGAQGPEYLEQGRGAPLHDGRQPVSGGRSSRRLGLLVGGGVLGLALVGGGVWAATSYLATGEQPTDALPDSTLGYVSVDLDPSGSQKLEALRTLREFPAFREKVGLETDDDVRKKIFDLIQDEARCEGLDYADDIEPWIGQRAALAAIDSGSKEPTPVFVLQVTDEGAAEEGLATLAKCSNDSTAGNGWAISDGWAVLAESDKVADQVVADADEAPLSDDADFQQWSEQAGDAGIVSMYAAPAAGAFLADNLGGMGTGTAAGAASGESLEDFEGAAARVRFADGGLELEMVGGLTAAGGEAFAGDGGDDVLATLPADTAAALGLGFSEGWFTDLATQMAAATGTSTEKLLAEASRSTGLDLPADAETLAGESFAVGIGGDVDADTLANSADGSDVPVAAKVRGDAGAIESVLDKVRAQMGGGGESVLGTDAEGDLVAIGPNPAYRATTLEDGGLGSSDAFTRVVPRAEDASAVLFVNFDAGDNWLAGLAGDDQQVAENLEPLEGLGVSTWQDGGTGHALVRVTTN